MPAAPARVDADAPSHRKAASQRLYESDQALQVLGARGRVCTERVREAAV